MRRADEVFEFEQRMALSPMVEQVWQTHSEADGRFISAAVSHWEMVVTRLPDATEVTVRGPETTDRDPRGGRRRCVCRAARSRRRTGA